MVLLKRCAVLLFCLLVVSASAFPAEKKVPHEKALVVDVCTPWEFRQRHVPAAVNIPLDEIEGRLKEFGDKNRPIVVYCSSGLRAEMAKEKLDANGFKNVANGGSIDEMIKKSAVETSTTTVSTTR